MKALLIGIVILAYVVPFAYMFVAVFFDVSKRLAESLSVRVKPVLVVITKAFID
jgi:hypothetical protein